MFLFDKYRTSQQKHTTGNRLGTLKWKTYLNTYPAYCAESTAALDCAGNLFFGSHSGNFYSLSPQGDVRWTFSTKLKIYGSPVVLDERVFFAGGDGYLYALSVHDGSIVWVKNLKQGFDGNFKTKLFQSLIHLPYTLNLKRLMNMDTKCWASVNHSNGMLFVTGFGKGIYVFDVEGNEQWSYDLGFPRYQLSGVVLDEDDNAYFPSRSGNIYCLSSSGNQIWKKAGMRGWHAWGSPSYNPSTGYVQFVFSKGESKGIVYASNKAGELIWKTKLKGAIHGSVAVAKDGTHLYCSDFSGWLYKLNAQNGTIVRSIRLSTAIRALWTTPTVDFAGNVYISTKDSFSTGRVMKLDTDLEPIWEHSTNKTLSVPVILENGDVCFGSWDGCYYCLSTEI